MHMDDPYSKLRPTRPTPPDDLCGCQGEPPVKLMYTLTSNPIHCVNCNLEVPLERLGWAMNQCDAIAHWVFSYGAIYHLWLASGSYEAWAKAQLCDIGLPMNRAGLELCHMLTPVRHCYFWYFQDQSDDDFIPLSQCPKCQGALAVYSAGIFEQRRCEQCQIIMVGE